jgi:excinuclease ABC subunit A
MTLAELAVVMEGIESDLSPLAGEAVPGFLRKIRQRLAFLIEVGLAYLHLDRVAGTLSAGEVQRVRLAGLLGSGLTSLTLLLDEPTRGLHPSEVAELINALHTLRDEGNTVVVVEHDPLVMCAADYLIDMGPGAGKAGGKVVAQGKPQTSQADTSLLVGCGTSYTPKSYHRRQPQRWMIVVGARP